MTMKFRQKDLETMNVLISYWYYLVIKKKNNIQKITKEGFNEGDSGS